MSKYKYQKAIQAVNLLVSWSDRPVSKMKIAKLLWLADRLHLRKYGRPITFDRYCALPHGPVPSFTLDLINGNFAWRPESETEYRNAFIALDDRGFSMVVSVAHPDVMVFSDSDEAALKEVFSAVGGMSVTDLRRLSHKYPEWSRWEKDIEDKTKGSRFEMEYKDFFNNPGFDDPVSGDVSEDVLFTNLKVYEETEAIRNVFA